MKKRIKIIMAVAAVLTLAMAVSPVLATSEEIVTQVTAGPVEQVQVIPGDANGDGAVNAIDITKVERIIAQLDPLMPGADANQDGSINALDITKVERIIAQLDPLMPGADTSQDGTS